MAMEKKFSGLLKAKKRLAPARASKPEPLLSKQGTTASERNVGR
jgi:hypothetical protein